MRMDASVVESGHEWATACALQRRFMQHTAPECGLFDYSALCRQAHQLGGDCYDFAPLAHQRLTVMVGCGGTDDLHGAILSSHRGIVHRRRPGGPPRHREPPGVCFIAHESIRNTVLRRF